MYFNGAIWFMSNRGLANSQAIYIVVKLFWKMITSAMTFFRTISAGYILESNCKEKNNKVVVNWKNPQSCDSRHKTLSSDVFYPSKIRVDWSWGEDLATPTLAPSPAPHLPRPSLAPV